MLIPTITFFFMTDGYLEFDEYIVASEPHKRERAEAWKVAIGLQAVDGQQDNGRRIVEGTYKDHRMDTKQVELWKM